MVHFCANDNYRKQWEVLGLPQSMGRTFFWLFVVPKVLEATKIIRSEYLFLFAADLSDDGMLLAYYEDLGFSDEPTHKVAIPLYDVACKFMFQRIIELEKRKEMFFNNYNPNNDAI